MARLERLFTADNVWGIAAVLLNTAVALSIRKVTARDRERALYWLCAFEAA